MTLLTLLSRPLYSGYFREDSPGSDVVVEVHRESTLSPPFGPQGEVGEGDLSTVTRTDLEI